jgi:hypothetical protein
MWSRRAPAKATDRWRRERDTFERSDLLGAADPGAKQFFAVGDHDRSGFFSGKRKRNRLKQAGEEQPEQLIPDHDYGLFLDVWFM